MSSASSHHVPRERRFSFRGNVRINVELNPWRILLTSQGVDISNSGILTKFNESSTSSQMTISDIHYLLTIGEEVGVQLEHHDIDLPITYVPAIVARKQVLNDTVLEVGFTFAKTSDELRSLIHEISQA